MRPAVAIQILLGPLIWRPATCSMRLQAATYSHFLLAAILTGFALISNRLLVALARIRSHLRADRAKLDMSVGTSFTARICWCCTCVDWLKHQANLLSRAASLNWSSHRQIKQRYGLTLTAESNLSAAIDHSSRSQHEPHVAQLWVWWITLRCKMHRLARCLSTALLVIG